MRDFFVIETPTKKFLTDTLRFTRKATVAAFVDDFVWPRGEAVCKQRWKEFRTLGYRAVRVTFVKKEQPKGDFNHE